MNTKCAPRHLRDSLPCYFAEPLERRVLLASFPGISLQDEFDLFGSGPTTSPCPDTMGAIGPNHFMEEIKGAVAIYDKASGARLSAVTLANFFTVTIGGTTYPRVGISDPHVVYDQHSGHWFAIALELGASGNDDNGIMLAVSRTNDPTGTWDKYFLDIGFPGVFTDYDTLGVDDNGVYLAANMFGGTVTCQIIATPKAPLIAATPSLGTVFQFPNIGDLFAAQPAFNFDPVGPSGKAWFVSTSTTGNANVNYRTMTWSGGVPTLSGTTVVTTPAYGNPPNAPAQGSTTNINVVDDRLNMAIIRDGHLWTTRNIGVNATGGATGANRTGVEWINLNVTGASATLADSGRIYDPAATTPRYYYVPSLTVNAQGAMRVGFSGSKSTEFVGAYVSGRAPGDPAGFATAPALIKAGEASYTRLDNSGRNRWGDYSYTSVDPNDDLTIWTIQEYAESVAPNIWGTWIVSMQPNGIWDGGGDGTNWTDPVNWSNDVLPGASDAVVINVAGTPTITLAGGTQTIFSLKNEENLIVNGGTLSIATSSVLNGSLTLSGGTLTGAGNVTLANANNVWSAGAMSGSGKTIIAAGASLQITGSGLRQSDREINIQGSATMQPGGSLVLKTTSGLTLGPLATLDVADNALIVDYTSPTPTPISTIRSLLTSGYNAGAWNGIGVNSSIAASTANHALGYAEASALTTIPPIFASADLTAVLVRYTRYGDTDLDQLVNVNDFTRLAGSFGQTGTVWSEGNFNYDNVTNVNDFTLLASNFGLASGSNRLALGMVRTPTVPPLFGGRKIVESDAEDVLETSVGA